MPVFTSFILQTLLPAYMATYINKRAHQLPHSDQEITLIVVVLRLQQLLTKLMTSECDRIFGSILALTLP